MNMKHRERAYLFTCRFMFKTTQWILIKYDADRAIYIKKCSEIFILFILVKHKSYFTGK
jgi:hypothetical protein